MPFRTLFALVESGTTLGNRGKSIHVQLTPNQGETKVLLSECVYHRQDVEQLLIKHHANHHISYGQESGSYHCQPQITLLSAVSSGSIGGRKAVGESHVEVVGHLKTLTHTSRFASKKISLIPTNF